MDVVRSIGRATLPPACPQSGLDSFAISRLSLVVGKARAGVDGCVCYCVRPNFYSPHYQQQQQQQEPSRATITCAKAKCVCVCEFAWSRKREGQSNLYEYGKWLPPTAHTHTYILSMPYKS